MKIPIKIVLSLFLIFFIGSPGFSRNKFQLEFSFSPGFPLNEFRENIKRSAPGGEILFLYKIPKSPLSIGSSIGFMVYGSETREEPFTPAIPDILVDVKTRNSILICHFLTRVHLREAKFSPYIDGLIGFNYFWTETGVYDQSRWGSSFASSVNFDDITLSFGVGVGALLRLYERKGRRPFSVGLDLAAHYLEGGKVEYLKKGMLHWVNGRAEYDVLRSTSDLLKGRIGISFIF